MKIKLSGSVALIVGGLLFFPSVLVQANDWQNPTGVCMNCGDDSPSPVYNEPRQRREKEWEVSPEQVAELNAIARAFDEQVQAVWARKDFREYLRLCQERQKVADGPTLRRWISSAKAVIAWTEAKTAAELRHAISMEPKAFTDENLRHVESVEAAEKAERERPAREARERKAAEANARVREKEDIAAVTKINARIREFTANLDTGPATAGTVVKAPGVLEFGDPNDLEAISEQARQGFDNDRRLMGTVTVAPPKDVASTDPRMLKATAELADLKTEQAVIDKAIAKLTSERIVAKDSAVVQDLTSAIDAQNKIKEEKLFDVYKKEEKIKVLHRVISTEKKRN